ncbi:hypothetical protein FB45DRAFT_930288 [Roridomyces roridus]|uniref:Cupredoxin n=1 Tax=Roridomyces roridus TaxID=1738132 RepID=A0AAD7BF47_9AGAR|nr:hypothetical protein FB45DRAFT_948284 [Roridomyces roridus]KAJ7619268.1 hypothetical protein FB45DRAFT_930288 [Roridomyces roridus]
MQLFTIAAALSAAAVATAQQVITVNVGGTATQGGFLFSPNNITAANGTIINFQFTSRPGNHSVTQSSFKTPCEPLPNGLDSGWIGIPQTLAADPSPEWNITITNDQQPIWLFCKQLLPTPHCTSGMIAAINIQPGPNTLDAFAANAKAATSVGQGEGAGNSGPGASANADPSLVSGAVRATAAQASSTAPAPSGSGSGSGGSGSNSASAPGSSSSNKPGAAKAQFDLSFFAVLGGAVAGAFLVL